jgi:hypothetical protein
MDALYLATASASQLTSNATGFRNAAQALELIDNVIAPTPMKPGRKPIEVACGGTFLPADEPRYHFC